MKKRDDVLFGFAVLLITILLILSSCASDVFYKQDGLVPLGYFQAIKKQDERLLFISARLIPNHRQSGLYIITNPENIQDALGVLKDPSVIAPDELNRILKPYSPVLIMSNNLSNGPEDGIAAFSLPSSLDQFFYAYVRINQNYRWGSKDPVEVRVGIIPLPPGSADVCITFSEKNEDMEIIANSNPDFIQLIYDTSTGFYGHLLGDEEQAGFIPIGFAERFEISKTTSPPRDSHLTDVIGSLGRNSYVRTNDLLVYNFTYYEFSDGCLFLRPRHYDLSSDGQSYQHRNNDNAVVRSQIDDFWNAVRRYNAIEYGSQRHTAGDYVYEITKSYDVQSHGSNRMAEYGGGSSGVDGFSDHYTIYSCNIFQVR